MFIEREVSLEKVDTDILFYFPTIFKCYFFTMRFTKRYTTVAGRPGRGRAERLVKDNTVKGNTIKIAEECGS